MCLFRRNVAAALVCICKARQSPSEVNDTWSNTQLIILVQVMTLVWFADHHCLLRCMNWRVFVHWLSFMNWLVLSCTKVTIIIQAHYPSADLLPNAAVYQDWLNPVCNKMHVCKSPLPGSAMFIWYSLWNFSVLILVWNPYC